MLSRLSSFIKNLMFQNHLKPIIFNHEGFFYKYKSEIQFYDKNVITEFDKLANIQTDYIMNKIVLTKKFATYFTSLPYNDQNIGLWLQTPFTQEELIWKPIDINTYKFIHNNKLYRSTNKYIVDSRNFTDQIITDVDDMKFHKY
jgi:hypothetical protein